MKNTNTPETYGCAWMIIALFVGLSLVILASNWKQEPNETGLEIYTKDNIYYIDGLTVTNEANSAVKKFKNKEELKEYISNLTAKQWEQ